LRNNKPFFLLMKKRLYYFDLIRVFLTMLVFYHHAAITFGASGGWYYISKETTSGLTQLLLSANMAVDQSYFMSLFFFISAYLMPRSYDSKGAKAFLLDRFNRLGIPLLIYTFALNPLLIYWIYGSWYETGFGPMLFVFTLLIFELSYACYRYILPRQFILRWKRLTAAHILCFILATGIIAFISRFYYPIGRNFIGLQLGFYPLYIGMYLLGIIAYRNQWLERLQVKKALPLFLIAILCGIPSLLIMASIFPTQTEKFMGGFNYMALFYALWEPVMCVGISYFLLAYGKTHYNKPMPTIQKLSADSYAAYIIHPIILVGCTFASEQLPVSSPLMRLALVCILGIPICFIFAKGFRRALGIVHVNI